MRAGITTLDHLTVHSDDIGEVVGSFYGNPIRLWNPKDSDRRVDADAVERLVHSNLQTMLRAEKEKANALSTPN